jgi:hypothetical protein
MIKFGRLVILAALFGAASLQPAAAQLTPEQEAWGQKMAGITPPGVGCYGASYPNLVWSSIRCMNGFFEPQLRLGREGMSKSAANVSDYSLSAPAPITQAVGSFPFATLVPGDQPGQVGAYSLQLNTDGEPGMCPTGDGDELSCRLDLQFVYSRSPQPQGQGSVFMQYWMHYAEYVDCPDGWLEQARSCYFNSPVIVVGSDLQTNMFNIGTYQLYGYAARKKDDGTTVDGVVFQQRNNIYTVVYSMDFFRLQNWRAAEFNIFGNGNSTQVKFGDGTFLQPKVGAWYDGFKTVPPDCINQTRTAETNNLNFGGCWDFPYDASKPDSYPYISFNEYLGRIASPPTIAEPSGEYPPDASIPLRGYGQPGAVIRVKLDGNMICYTRAQLEIGDDFRMFRCPDLKDLAPGRHVISATQGVPDSLDFPSGMQTGPAEREFYVLPQ